MKTIVIESLSNGWLVRPFQACPEWATSDRPLMAVYNKIEDLQRELPALLQFEKPKPSDDKAAS